MQLRTGIILGGLAVGATAVAATAIAIARAADERQQPTDAVLYKYFNKLERGPDGVSIADGAHVKWPVDKYSRPEGYTDYTTVFTAIDAHEYGPRSAYRAGIDVQGDGKVNPNELQIFADSFDIDGTSGLSRAERSELTRELRPQWIQTGPAK